ncbi:DUF7151 family protein [Algoriphagus terrigena]|uniref:DUF7151 family protein n=1 Tax=Algoriphagus terrigena TaxID=344884 RepID=UPI0003F55A48|nr:hypothetical protein [Algoriphagus terrigena]
MRKVSIYTLSIVLTGCSLFEGPEGQTSLLDISDELAGQNCPNGGIKIISGIDSNKNGILDNNEFTSAKYVCSGENGTAGNDGVNSLILTEEISAGNICSNGGIEVNSGSDINRNGILDDSEIEISKYICNGVDGMFDKQIRFTLPGNVSIDGSQVISEGVNNIQKFNIDDFAGIDSVIYTIWTDVPHADNTNSIELFNITDNIEIAGSKITATSNSTRTLYQSSNIIDGFPHKEITLGLKFKGANPGQFVSATGGYLYLYRK